MLELIAGLVGLGVVVTLLMLREAVMDLRQTLISFWAARESKDPVSNDIEPMKGWMDITKDPVPPRGGTGVVKSR